MKLFEIDTTHPYRITISAEIAPEDVIGDAFTLEEIQELTGVSHLYGGNRTILRETVVKDALIALKQQAVAAGKKTIVIKDAQLLDAIKGGYNVSSFVQGMRRVGDRLFVEHVDKKKELVLKKTHARDLINKGMVLIRARFDLKSHQLDPKYVNENYEGFVKFIQALLTWDELSATLSDEERPFIKQVWDNPAIFSKDKSEEKTDENDQE